MRFLFVLPYRQSQMYKTGSSRLFVQNKRVKFAEDLSDSLLPNESWILLQYNREIRTTCMFSNERGWMEYHLSIYRFTLRLCDEIGYLQDQKTKEVFESKANDACDWAFGRFKWRKRGSKTNKQTDNWQTDNKHIIDWFNKSNLQRGVILIYL